MNSPITGPSRVVEGRDIVASARRPPYRRRHRDPSVRAQPEAGATLKSTPEIKAAGVLGLANRRYLRQGDHAYIIGEKLRSDSVEIKAALSRQGRYTTIAENMRVKEVEISDSERFVICHNPDGAERDAHIRAQLIAQLEELIAGSDTLPVMKRGELRGRISTKPGLHRYLRVTPGGLLRVDKARCKTEANLDGKYLLRCSDPHLSPADIALGYKQLHRAGPRSTPTSS